jgi:hypothetical protein
MDRRHGHRSTKKREVTSVKKTVQAANLAPPFAEAMRIVQSEDFSDENHEALRNLAKQNPEYRDEIGMMIEAFIVAKYDSVSQT